MPLKQKLCQQGWVLEILVLGKMGEGWALGRNERSKAGMKNTAYQPAYAKSDESSKSLRLEQTPQTKVEEEGTLCLWMMMKIFTGHWKEQGK